MDSMIPNGASLPQPQTLLNSPFCPQTSEQNIESRSQLPSKSVPKENNSSHNPAHLQDFQEQISRILYTAELKISKVMSEWFISQQDVAQAIDSYRAGQGATIDQYQVVETANTEQYRLVMGANPWWGNSSKWFKLGQYHEQADVPTQNSNRSASDDASTIADKDAQIKFLAAKQEEQMGTIQELCSDIVFYSEEVKRLHEFHKAKDAEVRVLKRALADLSAHSYAAPSVKASHAALVESIIGAATEVRLAMDAVQFDNALAERQQQSASQQASKPTGAEQKYLTLATEADLGIQNKKLTMLAVKVDSLQKQLLRTEDVVARLGSKSRGLSSAADTALPGPPDNSIRGSSCRSSRSWEELASYSGDEQYYELDAWKAGAVEAGETLRQTPNGASVAPGLK